MAKIININDFLKRKEKKDDDLNFFLKEAILLRKKSLKLKGEINLIDQKDFKTFLEGKIFDLLIRKKNIGSEFFLCGNYIAILLTEILSKIPETWFAIDYIINSNNTNNPKFLKEGANVCFLICTLFKKRSSIRCMKYDDYREMGKGMYYQFYSQTGKEIGFHMSIRYEIMVEITNKCLEEIKN